MPNWATSIIIATGKFEDVKKFYDQFAKPAFVHQGLTNPKVEVYKKFSLRNFVPLKPEEEEGEKWYDVRNTKWGTKWDVVDIEAVFNRSKKDKANGITCITFQTAWSAPFPVFDVMETSHPNVSFKFMVHNEFFTGFYLYNRTKDEDTEEVSLKEINEMSEGLLRVDVYNETSENEYTWVYLSEDKLTFSNEMAFVEIDE